ncbi:NAD(P)/FAD-dependent oxidoreductase [Salipiger abyssi]|uniref:NAD(FAD)-dependent dehydrogenase n=1 Tax=Salipiger abyssi TaxID=1250539 RepID=A0A1P8UMF7_9RHOB|nr:NAD(P)/FAD-dependent oxidoreductase [Salipiger abyssi]APZ50576.1 NAD(FAD)-dependent dehydrogenase [Salipiger abyssi]
MSRQDLCIIGAGPAGMAAAVAARQNGLSVTVLDEAPRPGGQIYRDITRAPEPRQALLGPDYRAGAGLAQAFAKSGCTHLAGATVWHIEQDGAGFALSYSMAEGSRVVEADALIVATGALERPMPLPGWTLPGVTTTGALQILMKSAGVLAESPVLVGSGPLQLLLAAQLVAAGRPPRAIVETVPAENMRHALKHLPRALRGAGYLVKGAGLLARLRRAGVPIYRDARDIVLEGEDRLEAVSFTIRGRAHRIETGSAGLHHGVVPNPQVTRLMRCEHRWHEGQRAFVPVCDAYGESSVPGLFVAGDGAGIRGARSAALAGRLAALRVAERAGQAVSPEIVKLRRAMARDAAVRPFLETLYAPCAQALSPAEDTLVCRCEEVTAGQIRAAAKANAPGPNQVKSFLRTGMGPCQGRVCGLAVTALLAESSGRSPDETGYFRIRPPLKPLSLSELAEFVPQEE